MKKALSLLVALMVLCSVSALAETTAPAIDTTGWATVEMADIGLSFLRPTDLEPMELTDEDYNNGIAYAAKSDALSLVVYLWELDDATTLDAVETELAADEAYQCQRVLIGEVDALAFETTKDDQLVDGVILMGSDGYAYQFMFMVTDEASKTLASTIMNTLAPMETTAQ